MKSEHFEFKKTYSVNLKNGLKVDVYKIARGKLCNAKDCTTEYEFEEVASINN